MKRVLVTGGTGVLGRELVPRLARAGYVVRIMSRRSPGTADRASPAGPAGPAEVEWAQADLETGMGLAEAVAGADMIVHAATSSFARNMLGYGIHATDVRGTAQLLEHARAAGVEHFLYVSIVGIEKLPHAYYRHKLAAEALVGGAGVPWSILRATQFHPLIDRMLRVMTVSPLVLLPADFKYQPIDPGDVADHLVDCVARGAAGRLPDLGGPEVHSLGDLAEAWMQACGMRRPVLRLHLPGRLAAAFRQGLNTAPARKSGRVTWEDWLRRTYGAEGKRDGEARHAD